MGDRIGNLLYTFATQNPIFKIFFSNENVGWVITWTTGSTLLKTIDAGENWLPVYSYQGATNYINDFVIYKSRYRLVCRRTNNQFL